MSWLKDQKSNPLTKLDNFVFGTCIHHVISIFSCRNSRLKRVKRLITEAESQTEKALDLRSLLKMQSVVAALARIVLDRKSLRSLSKFQMRKRVIAIDPEDAPSDSFADLLEPSSTDESKKIYRVASSPKRGSLAEALDEYLGEQGFVWPQSHTQEFKLLQGVVPIKPQKSNTSQN